MAINYAYNFAEIDPTDNMCIGVMTTTNPNQNPEFLFRLQHMMVLMLRSITIGILESGIMTKK
jgi:hypothetical protein